MTVAASIIAWALLAGGSPQSQALDATVATLDVRPGERLIVTTPRETIRGRVLRLTSDRLVLADGPAQHTVPLHDLNRVERRRDSVWNGALIGYGVGFGVGFALNGVSVLGADASMLLAVVVVGTIGSELVAALLPPRSATQ